MKKVILMILFLLVVFSFACSKKTIDPYDDGDQSSQIANPASTYCVEQGGKLRIVDTESGQIGICTLKDGKECEEWSYMRGECPVKCGECPQFSPPSPDFCKEGTIVPREPDECGCVGPPWCQI